MRFRSHEQLRLSKFGLLVVAAAALVVLGALDYYTRLGLSEFGPMAVALFAGVVPVAFFLRRRVTKLDRSNTRSWSLWLPYAVVLGGLCGTLWGLSAYSAELQTSPGAATWASFYVRDYLRLATVGLLPFYLSVIFEVALGERGTGLVTGLLDFGVLWMAGVFFWLCDGVMETYRAFAVFQLTTLTALTLITAWPSLQRRSQSRFPPWVVAVGAVVVAIGLDLTLDMLGLPHPFLLFPRLKFYIL